MAAAPQALTSVNALRQLYDQDIIPNSQWKIARLIAVDRETHQAFYARPAEDLPKR